MLAVSQSVDNYSTPEIRVDAQTGVTNLARGESVKIIVYYDLFDRDVNGCLGIYLKQNHDSGKCLVYFPEFEDWGEFREGQFERLFPGFIPDKNKDFVSNVKTLGWDPSV